MRLASYNIQYGKGKDDRFDLDRIVSELGAADLIALQEVETHAARSGDVHQGAEIAARLAEEAMFDLVAPIKRVAGYDIPIPLFRLEMEYLPSVQRIADGVRGVMAYR
jgi:endonuclease/exonuclease/phosphatase family metal-dependent hydrolase